MKKAFTLAEVLITIVIIGIIAAITTPIIITNYQKQTCVKKLKKSYSTLSQAITRSTIENGNLTGWKYNNTDDFAQKYLLPYLQVLEYEKNSDYLNKIKGLNGQSFTKSTFDNGNRIILNDGTSILFKTFLSSSYSYASFLIDINSEKKPNTVGKDVFLYRLFISGVEDYDGKLLAFSPDVSGVPDNIKILIEEYMIRNSVTGCNKNGDGTYCAKLLMDNSWEMPKDYPW